MSKTVVYSTNPYLALHDISGLGPSAKYYFDGTTYATLNTPWAANGIPSEWSFKFNADAVATGSTQYILSGEEGGVGFAAALQDAGAWIQFEYRGADGLQKNGFAVEIDIVAGEDYHVVVTSLGEDPVITVNGIAQGLFPAPVAVTGIQPAFSRIGMKYDGTLGFAGTIWDIDLGDDTPIQGDFYNIGNNASYGTLDNPIALTSDDFYIKFNWRREANNGLCYLYSDSTGLNLGAIRLYNNNHASWPDAISLLLGGNRLDFGITADASQSILNGIEYGQDIVVEIIAGDTIQILINGVEPPQSPNNLANPRVPWNIDRIFTNYNASNKLVNGTFSDFVIQQNGVTYTYPLDPVENDPYLIVNTSPDTYLMPLTSATTLPGADPKHWANAAVVGDAFVVTNPDGSPRMSDEGPGGRAVMFEDYGSSDVTVTCNRLAYAHSGPLVCVAPNTKTYGISVYYEPAFDAYILWRVGRIPTDIGDTDWSLLAIKSGEVGLDGNDIELKMEVSGGQVWCYADDVLKIGPIDIPDELIGSTLHGISLDVGPTTVGGVPQMSYPYTAVGKTGYNGAWDTVNWQYVTPNSIKYRMDEDGGLVLHDSLYEPELWTGILETTGSLTTWDGTTLHMDGTNTTGTLGSTYPVETGETYRVRFDYASGTSSAVYVRVGGGGDVDTLLNPVSGSYDATLTAAGTGYLIQILSADNIIDITNFSVEAVSKLPTAATLSSDTGWPVPTSFGPSFGPSFGE